MRELSERNPYWIEKHRYHELKYFCRQYPIWKKAYVALDGLSKRPEDFALFAKKKRKNGDPTARCATARAYYAERMAMIEQTAKEADQDLSAYILEGVTVGLSYEGLKARLDIPCSRDTYYDRYRRFFWLLNKKRE